MTGKVSSIVREKGFGFISSKSQEYFFHRSGFQGHWEDLIIDYMDGKEIEVEFDEGSSHKGPRAENVRRLDHPNQ